MSLINTTHDRNYVVKELKSKLGGVNGKLGCWRADAS